MRRLFRVPWEGHGLVGHVLAGEEPPRLLVLHGGGRSNRERLRLLREHLFTHAVGSVAFDCVGHGDTGGDLKRSSLQSRTAQASAVIDALALPQPFSILAASMGGYTAVAVTLLRSMLWPASSSSAPPCTRPRRTRFPSTPGLPRSSGAPTAGDLRMRGISCRDSRDACSSWSRA